MPQSRAIGASVCWLGLGMALLASVNAELKMVGHKIPVSYSREDFNEAKQIRVKMAVAEALKITPESVSLEVSPVAGEEEIMAAVGTTFAASGCCNLNPCNGVTLPLECPWRPQTTNMTNVESLDTVSLARMFDTCESVRQGIADDSEVELCGCGATPPTTCELQTAFRTVTHFDVGVLAHDVTESQLRDISVSCCADPSGCDPVCFVCTGETEGEDSERTCFGEPEIQSEHLDESDTWQGALLEVHNVTADGITYNLEEVHNVTADGITYNSTQTWTREMQ